MGTNEKSGTGNGYEKKKLQTRFLKRKVILCDCPMSSLINSRRKNYIKKVCNFIVLCVPTSDAALLCPLRELNSNGVAETITTNEECNK